MTAPRRSDIDALLAREGESECVSILVPTVRAGKEVQQAKIRLKNLLREAEGRLSGNGTRKDEIHTMLRPGHDLLEDEGLWRALEDGLAIFLAPGFSLSLTVPAPVEETLVIGRSFYVLPLVPLIENRAAFFILALSLNDVRFFSADRFAAGEVAELPGVPRSLTDAVGSDFEDDDVQIHSVKRGPGGAIVHGHGAGQAEVEKEESAVFCLRVDAALRAILGDNRRPMVLAAAEPLASIYRQVSRYQGLVPGTVSGNPELLSGEDLRQRAWKVVEPLLRQEVEVDLARCRELLGTGLASTDTREIVVAAFDGRVDTLLVSEGARRWGTFDPATRVVEIADEPANGREELLNLAAGQTVRASGTLRLVPRAEMPEQANAAAVFRY